MVQVYVVTKETGMLWKMDPLKLASYDITLDADKNQPNIQGFAKVSPSQAVSLGLVHLTSVNSPNRLVVRLSIKIKASKMRVACAFSTINCDLTHVNKVV